MNTAMNTVNQTFNWSRFTAALRKELVENKRAILSPCWAPMACSR